MAFRIHVIAACIAGSVVSVLVAILVMLKTGQPALAFLPTLLVPSMFCWFAGLRQRETLVMIAVFAAIGWFAGTLATPTVSMSRQQRIEKNAQLPLAGNDPIIPCAIAGGIFAIARSCFIGSPRIASDRIDSGELPKRE